MTDSRLTTFFISYRGSGASIIVCKTLSCLIYFDLLVVYKGSFLIFRSNPSIHDCHHLRVSGLPDLNINTYWLEVVLASQLDFLQTRLKPEDWHNFHVRILTHLLEGFLTTISPNEVRDITSESSTDFAAKVTYHLLEEVGGWFSILKYFKVKHESLKEAVIVGKGHMGSRTLKDFCGSSTLQSWRFQRRYSFFFLIR